MNDQNPRNKVKMCAWCEYRVAKDDSALCEPCANMKPLWQYLRGGDLDLNA